jgi:ribosome-binding protein aMBF1 (putative translation factor)
MIKNERQYRITMSQIAKFEAALEEVAARANSSVPARLRKLEQDALGSQLEEMREEAAQYERLRSGRREPISIPSFDQLPQALVQARIARGLTQKELAERLGLKEQQIQRYEATEYASASLTRIKKVMAALGAKLAAEMTYSGR